jgi:cytochrome c
MKKIRLIAVTASLVMAGTLSSIQYATADEAMAQKKGCLACHGIDKKIVGPSFKDIAAKYKADEAAVSTLAEKVIKGGSGNWGSIPMPPNSTLSAEEAESLVTWVLEQ